jgi:hypothetical protein
MAAANSQSQIAGAGTINKPYKDFGPLLLSVVWSLVALSMVFLGLRIFCKLKSQRSLLLDDKILIASGVRLDYILFGDDWLTVI